MATSLGFQWNSFGSTIKNIAVEQSLGTDRKSLQALGEKLVANQPEDLCRRVIAEAEASSTQPIVIDGLRHQHILEILQRLLSPAHLAVVFVDVSDSVRMERLRVRDGLTDLQVQELETHSTETQVDAAIRKLADFVVDNSGTLESTVAELVARLKSGGLAARPF